MIYYIERRDGALASDVDTHETPLARLQSQLDEQSDSSENRPERGRWPSSSVDSNSDSSNNCNISNTDNNNNSTWNNAGKMHIVSG